MLKIVENLWAVGGPPQTPLGALTALPRPLASREGVAAPFQEPPLPPLSAFSPSVLPPVKNPGRALGVGGNVL